MATYNDKIKDLNDKFETVRKIFVTKDVAEGDFSVVGDTYKRIYTKIIDMIREGELSEEKAILLATQICSMDYSTLKFIIDFSREAE